MRKDVRIGLSIGGVLLAVLIVYLLVPKNNPNKNQQLARAGADASTPGGGGGASGDTSGGAGSGGASDSNVTQNNVNPGGGGTNAGGAGTDANRESSAGVANGGTGAGASGAGTNGEAPASGGTGAGEATAAGGAAPDVWGKLLDEGPRSPALIAAGRDFFEDQNHAGSTPGKARTSEAGPDDKIVFETPGAGQAGGNNLSGGAGNPPNTGTPNTGTPNIGTPNTGTPNTGTPNTGTPRAGTPNTGPAAGGPTAPAAGLKEHTIRSGETFSSIALVLYGDSKHWKDIKKVNPNVDDTKLRPGTVIKLPDAVAIKGAQQAGQGGAAQTAGATMKAEPAIDATKEYRVQPGDSLQKIALKLYGKSTKGDSIYEANKDKIGADPHRIKVGMVLKLPEAPTASSPMPR